MANIFKTTFFKILRFARMFCKILKQCQAIGNDLNINNEV